MIANHYWAAHLGCSPAELFGEPFRIITHGGELIDYNGVFALFRDGAAIRIAQALGFEAYATSMAIRL